VFDDVLQRLLRDAEQIERCVGRDTRASGTLPELDSNAISTSHVMADLRCIIRRTRQHTGCHSATSQKPLIVQQDRAANAPESRAARIPSRVDADISEHLQSDRPTAGPGDHLPRHFAGKPADVHQAAESRGWHGARRETSEACRLGLYRPAASRRSTDFRTTLAWSSASWLSRYRSSLCETDRALLR
jgi:hypothetical protein